MAVRDIEEHLWFALVDVTKLAAPSVLPTWAAGAYVHVAGYAETPEQFRRRIEGAGVTRGLRVRDVDWVRRADEMTEADVSDGELERWSAVALDATVAWGDTFSCYRTDGGAE